MAEIFVFRSDETPKLNYQAIYTLFSELGLEQGLCIFERILREVSGGLYQLELAIHEVDIKTVRCAASSLCMLGPQIGLECLAHIAREIIDVIACNNMNALPAICYRIICLGEACLFRLSSLPRVLED